MLRSEISVFKVSVRTPCVSGATTVVLGFSSSLRSGLPAGRLGSGVLSARDLGPQVWDGGLRSKVWFPSRGILTFSREIGCVVATPHRGPQPCSSLLAVPLRFTLHGWKHGCRYRPCYDISLSFLCCNRTTGESSSSWVDRGPVLSGIQGRRRWRRPEGDRRAPGRSLSSLPVPSLGR